MNTNKIDMIREERDRRFVNWVCIAVIGVIAFSYIHYFFLADHEAEAKWEQEKAEMYERESRLYTGMIQFHLDCLEGEPLKAPRLLTMLLNSGGVDEEQYCTAFRIQEGVAVE